ncbi:MAG: hypothetical protein SFV54_13140 [Bryobacteraceae bacterium]|nr:hypothetical protein [Bryobacteraceae bacterium]
MQPRAVRVSLAATEDVRRAANALFALCGRRAEFSAQGERADVCLLYSPLAAGQSIEAALANGFDAVLGPGFLPVFGLPR